MNASCDENSKDSTIRYDLRQVNSASQGAVSNNKAPSSEQQQPLNLTFPSSSKLDATSTSRPGENVPQQFPKTFRTWWVHLWSGLVRDPKGKHYEALKQAVWLYLYLLIAANWRTGTLYRRTETIAAETGFDARNIRRWLKILRDKGYIHTTTNGRSLTVTITKWRPITRKSKS